MFRFGISMVWGLMSAVIVYGANDKLFAGLGAAAALAGVLGLSLWGADSFALPNGKLIRMANLPFRLGMWFVLYHVLPAAIIWVLASVLGLFVLPVGYATALVMCVPISLITLKDFVDLSWLNRLRR
jgi:hypothetical protein